MEKHGKLKENSASTWKKQQEELARRKELLRRIKEKLKRKSGVSTLSVRNKIKADETVLGVWVV